ncbi:GFA family protein, partial [Salmonella enterica]|nr:GFA family protein [Salmonella enterica]
MSSEVYDSLEGGCTCGAVRYVVTASPLIVHCCHCHWCQRETGSAFVINAVIENMHVHLIKGQVTVIDTPSLSGKGQKIARCPKCQIALWSHYSGSSKLTFLR